MLKKGLAKANGRDSATGRLPLASAAALVLPATRRAGCLALMEELMAAGADPNAAQDFQSKKGGTPLALVCARGDAAAAKTLLDGGASPFIESEWRHGKTSLSPICIAVLEGNEEILTDMLSRPDVRKGVAEGMASMSWGGILSLAGANDSMEGRAVEMLLAAGAVPREPSNTSNPSEKARGRSKDILRAAEEALALEESASRDAKEARRPRV